MMEIIQIRYADACSSIVIGCMWWEGSFVGHFYLGCACRYHKSCLLIYFHVCIIYIIGRIWMPNLNAKLVTRIAFGAVVYDHDVCPVHFRLQMLLMYSSIFPQTVIFFGSTRFVSYWSLRILSSCQCQICQCKELLLIWLRLLLRPFQSRFSSVIITSLHADSKPVWCCKPRNLSKSPVTNWTDLTLGILSMYPEHQKCQSHH